MDGRLDNDQARLHGVDLQSRGVQGQFPANAEMKMLVLAEKIMTLDDDKTSTNVRSIRTKPKKGWP